MEAPGFWDDPDRSNKQMKELKQLKDTVDQCNGLKSQYEDIETLIEMGYEAQDAEMIPEIREELDSFIGTFEELRISTLLSEEYDKCNAILKLNAGAGGTESCDWAGMLYRMYTRWAERKGFSIDVLDYLDGDEAGIKSVTFQVNGENAYGYLKSEKGVHRLVRISPFNAQGKRQTSFVSLDVMLDIEEDLDVEELPRIWADKYEEYLGVRPKDVAEGVLQDIHWSQGSFGYFPSYALGSAFGAQLYAYMKKEMDFEGLLEKGDMGRIREFLRENIHRYGKLKTSRQMLKDVTGEDFDPQYYIDYLTDKYGKLYGI